MQPKIITENVNMIMNIFELHDDSDAAHMICNSDVSGFRGVIVS